MMLKELVGMTVSVRGSRLIVVIIFSRVNYSGYLCRW
jgi:hypothetical protein